LEIIYALCIMFGTYSELNEMYMIWRQTGSVSEYFASAWNYIDLISIAASLISIAIWTYIAYYSAFVFDIELTYDVYTEPPHKWGRLDYKQDEFDKVITAFEQLRNLVLLQTVYLSLCGGNQFFFLMRLFKLLDFQPRIGILTRTIGRALEDLAHFMLLLIMVLMAYSAMGHIIFGPYVSAFKNFQTSFETIFDMLLGEFGDTKEELLSHDVDHGLLILPATLFFYSFMSIVFLVILNFLLAIIVDAFADEKHMEGEYDISVYEELGRMFKRVFKGRTQKDYDESKSLESIRRQVMALKADDNTAEKKDAHDLDEHDIKRTRIVEMRDDLFKVQLDQELLERVLQKDPLIDAHAKDGSIPKLAEAVAEVFGNKHDVSVLEEPIQKKDTDPVILKLLEMQESSVQESRMEDAMHGALMQKLADLEERMSVQEAESLHKHNHPPPRTQPVAPRVQPSATSFPAAGNEPTVDVLHPSTVGHKSPRSPSPFFQDSGLSDGEDDGEDEEPGSPPRLSLPMPPQRQQQRPSKMSMRDVYLAAAAKTGRRSFRIVQQARRPYDWYDSSHDWFRFGSGVEIDDASQDLGLSKIDLM